MLVSLFAVFLFLVCTKRKIIDRLSAMDHNKIVQFRDSEFLVPTLATEVHCFY